MYEVGDLIVYGRTGICEVTEITTLKMDGVPKDKLYYILRPVREKRGKVFTPVDNEKIVMRKVISKEEAEELIREIPQIEGLWRGKVQGMHEKLQMCRMGADHQDPLSAEDVPPEAGKEDHGD